jgi:hypothetical protein
VNNHVVASMMFIAGYLAVAGGSAMLFLWIQRKFFLLSDEDNSFVVPGLLAAFTGIMFLWMVITSGV